MQGYTFERVIELPNTVAKIYRPELTEDEKKQRLKAIHKAAANLLKGERK